MQINKKWRWQEFQTKVSPTVHNTPVKISDMVIFLHHDLYNIDSTCTGHHIIVTYFLSRVIWMKGPSKHYDRRLTEKLRVLCTKYFWKFNHLKKLKLLKIQYPWIHAYIKALTFWSWCTLYIEYVLSFLKNNLFQQLVIFLKKKKIEKIKILCISISLISIPT
jgi:hypothetical protein